MDIRMPPRACICWKAVLIRQIDRILAADEEKNGQFNDPGKLHRLDFLLSKAKNPGIDITQDLFTIRHAGNQAKYGIRDAAPPAGKAKIAEK